ncbi:respiratory nitrate reductase subunit gamma [Peribacillus tepidiphilus]|uniref:respiratory nitrate reductase subunit gamma n=1 Tax=Peribacillus tepidiphilus TaxID=2652445 RepID=UPI0012924CCB|nr:respiratory nitrate reductase subunit gamma [Peribacillus tepidiphilus]
MDLLQMMIWVIYPYVVVAILGMGIVWQYDEKHVEGNACSKKNLKLKLQKWIIKGLFLMSFLTGAGIIHFYSMVSEPKKLFLWVMSLIQLNPDMDIIKSISILSQAHVVLLMTLLLVLSFSHYLRFFLKPHRWLKYKRKTYKNNLNRIEEI